MIDFESDFIYFAYKLPSGRVQRRKFALHQRKINNISKCCFTRHRFRYKLIKIMSNHIYKDLKEQGLILSKQVQIGFPPIRAPKSSFVGQLFSYLVTEKNFENEKYELVIVPILNNCFLVGRCNTLLCFKYEIESEKQSAMPIISKPYIHNLPFIIDKIHICDDKYLKDVNLIPCLVESKNKIILFYVDLKENNINVVDKSTLTYTNVLSVRFICQKQFLVAQSNRSGYFLHHYSLQNKQIKQKSQNPADLEISSEEEVKQVNIFGNIDEQQISTVCLFYYLRAVGNQKSQILKVKQYKRDLEGNILSSHNYVVLQTQKSIVLGQKYEIVDFNNYYCILLKNQILILKKKFDKYLFIDSIMEKVSSNVLKLHAKGILTSHSGNSMEINIILFNDPKCSHKLLDNIQIPLEFSDGFIMCWPFSIQKETSLMFVFKKDKRLVFFNLRKTNPYEKMLLVVANTPKQKISVIQQIAVNLGISKKDFYLNQWMHSKREISDIYQFLLPCWDIQSIKKQLGTTMRRKKIQVSQLLKILEKLGKIIKNQLKTSLSQFLLKQYIKNDFLLKKIKLKEASKKMDYRQLDKVYHSRLTQIFVEIVNNQLYPSQKQLDPLHAMVQAPLKQQANLKHVFQQFRMTILEDYKTFLVEFISSFNETQIVQVISEYYYLLPTYKYKPNLIIHEPDYMTEVQLNQKILNAEKTQQQWFSDMTSIEFARQMSKQRIEKELHDDYPNSKIHEAINTLTNSEYGTSFKLQKHGLISCTMAQYKQKLKQIEGIKLYLKVCEHVNQYNIKEDNDVNLSKEIVEIFKQKNKLEGSDYQKVRLYTSMHRFMLKNNFCQKKIMTVQQLIELRQQDLVALFFLQNRQRKEYIFRQFRGLYIDLYKNAVQYNKVINKFITSQNCSRIQLQILINEIRNQGQQFQIQNQDLIQLIIDGFCKKLQIREQSDTQRFLDIMVEIQINKKLAMKINQINQIKGCISIFINFNLDKKSYYQILSLQQQNQIFKILMDIYFNQGMKKDYVIIQNDQISLQYCRNMLNVLLYLQENIYYEISQRDLMLTYCEVLIDWKQFEIIKGIIYDQQVLQTVQIEKNQFIRDLVQKSLNQIYSDQEIIYDLQTKQHVRSIIDIIEGQHQVKTQQYAKLQLVQIFENWGTTVHTHDIQLVLNQWAEGNRKDLIIDLINQYITFLNFSSFELIYKYLQIASGKPLDLVDIRNQEFIDFSITYAEKLLEEKVFDEIIKIITFVKSMPEAKKLNYALLSETFLQCLFKKYSNQEYIIMAKQAIEYFTQYFSEASQNIQQLFTTGLNSARFQFQREINPVIVVSPSFCYSKKYEVKIQLSILWQISRSQYEQKQKNIKNLYYSYYFLIMAFRNPDEGFSKNHHISYHYEILTDLLFKLEIKIDQNNHLWGINVYNLFKKFLKGLYLEGLTRIKEINPEIFKSFQNDDAQLDAIKMRLREDKQLNSELLKCVSRVQSYLSSYKIFKKAQKELKFQKFKQIINPQSMVLETEEVEDQPQVQIDNGITLKLRVFKDRKLQMSRQSNLSGILLSQKQILEKIYQLQMQFKQNNRKINNKKKQNNLFLAGLLNSSSKQATISSITKYIQIGQFQKIKQFQRQDVILAIQAIYNNPVNDLHQIVQILRNLAIVDEKKINVLLYCKYYMVQNNFILTSEELKKMFPFTYLIEPAEEDIMEFKDRMFMVMKGSFQSIIKGKDNDFIRNMANYIGNILNDNAYISRFYIDMIILLHKNPLSSQTIIRISIIMHILRQYPNEVRAYLTNILQAFKENSELLKIIKQQLLNCFEQTKDDLIDKYIKQY